MNNQHKYNNRGSGKAEDDGAIREDPAPAPEAVNEADDRPASNTLWVTVIVALVILGIFYLIFIF